MVCTHPISECECPLDGMISGLRTTPPLALHLLIVSSILISMAEILDNFRAAYATLECCIIQALCMQLGDAHQLGLQCSQALSMLHYAEQVRQSPLTEILLTL